jgi:glycosyltransferase involved in cell wall biosynthesis
MAEIRLLELRNTYKWGGGPDKTILLSAEQHDRTLVDVVVAYIRDIRDTEFCITDKARARGLTFYEIEERGRFDLRVLRALREIILRHNINLIHGHDYKSDLFAYLVCRQLGYRRPTAISTMHGWALGGPRGHLYWQLDRWLMRRFDRVIAVSHATMQEMVAAGVPPHLITVIYNGIDTDVWTPHQVRTALREELGLDPACPLVGYVGRITPEKDLDAWLHAASIVGQHSLEVHFVLVGDGRDGTLLGHLQKQVRKLGLAERVHFLGYRAQLLPIYTSFDLFMLSSRREGICNSLLEAMAVGLPVVTTDAGGTSELVLDGQTGYIVPQRDVNGLARATIKLINDASLRQRMGRAGRERVEAEFSFRLRLQRIEALYAAVLGVPRAPSLQEEHAEKLV